MTAFRTRYYPLSTRRRKRVRCQYRRLSSLINFPSENPAGCCYPMAHRKPLITDRTEQHKGQGPVLPLLSRGHLENGIPTVIPQPTRRDATFYLARGEKRLPLISAAGRTLFGHVPGLYRRNTGSHCARGLYRAARPQCNAPNGPLKRALYCRSLLGCCFLSQALVPCSLPLAPPIAASSSPLSSSARAAHLAISPTIHL